LDRPTAPSSERPALPAAPPVEAANHKDAKPRRFTIAATGDILVHEAVWQRAAIYGTQGGLGFDFQPMFAKVRPILASADLAICHMETPLSRDDSDLSSYPVFSVPHEVADAIAWAGYDECSTASNHSVDRGSDGIAATLDALDAVGVHHAGTSRTLQESRHITMLHVRGVRVAHLSYAYGFNGFTPDPSWEANQIEPGRILSDAERARARGAEFVIVSLHWGTQYQTAPNSYQLSVARRLTSSDAIDLILGHHAHVVQPIVRIRGTYVAYGMGNLVSGQTAASNGTPSVEDGVIVQVTVEEGRRGLRVTRVTYTPTWVEPGTYRILPVAPSIGAGWASEAERALLRASWDRTVSAITSLGADALGVEPRRPPQAA
jgi:poly-gamma-glutamate synthesis protein (capsule biosynthesis protein)